MPKITCSDEQFIRCLLKCVVENYEKHAREYTECRKQAFEALWNLTKAEIENAEGVDLLPLEFELTAKKFFVFTAYQDMMQCHEIIEHVQKNNFKPIIGKFQNSVNIVDSMTAYYVEQRIKELAEKYS